MATLRSDRRWMARWTHPATGKRMTVYAATEELADLRAAAALEEASRNDGPTPSTDLDLHTLAGILWFPRIEGNRPNTVRRYRDAYTSHIRPRFGSRTPEQIRPHDVQRWVGDLQKAGAAPNSIALYRSILSAILKLCVAEGLIASNPAATAKLPKAPKRVRTMTLQDLRTLLGRVEGGELAAPVFCAAVLGLSRGELAGLKWDNIDADRRRISIVEQRLIRQGERGKAVAEGPTKRDSRVRSFVLPQPLWEAFVRVANQDGRYVCVRANGRPWNPEHLTGEWGARRNELGFDGWHFHDLRHGAAGILAVLGVDLLTIAAVLGHASINTTLLYAAAQEAAATAGFGRVAEALFLVE